MEEEISAFSLLVDKRKSQKEKKKKKKASQNDSALDIKDLISKKKKELATDSSNGLASKKKRKQDALEEKEDDLWKTFEILNPPKKVKKSKGTKSIFSNCNVTEQSNNFFFNGETKKDSSKKKKLSLISSTPKNLQVETFQDLASSKEIKKKKSKKKHAAALPRLNSTGINPEETGKKLESFSGGSDIRTKKPVRIPKSVRADSVKVGESVFSWMISPVGIQDFFSDIWEKKPLHVIHNKQDFFSEVCSLQDFDDALRQNDVYFTKNIDVTSYVEGTRLDENPIGRARPSVVWDFYQRGKSIRMLNPQTFIPNVANLTASLQEFFRCFVGANIYLTPPDTQGFAPHYDDIEAFVLQLEGEKEWRLYNPRCPEELLPRISSPNFKEEEIGEPILEVTLKPGDLLYFPRGIIHQARCVPGKYSLHVTVSCYQKNSWADLFEKMLPVALERAVEEDVDFRKGLPIDFLDHMGLVHSDSESENRMQMLMQFEMLMKKLMKYCPVDAAADQIGRDFMHSALPPCLTKNELAHSLGRDDPAGKSSMLIALQAHSEKSLGVRLIRSHALRLVLEEDGLKVFYNTDNGKEYHALDELFFEIPEGWARGVDALIHNYPEFTRIKDLPLSDDEDPSSVGWDKQAFFAYYFWEKGLLLFDVQVSEI